MNFDLLFPYFLTDVGEIPWWISTHNVVKELWGFCISMS